MVRSTSLEGLVIPANVKVHVNLSFEASQKILLHSRFMVLPLMNSEVPCGHVTIVAAMHLGKAMIVTASSGVADYVRDGENALMVPPARSDKLVSAAKRLWEDRALCDRLGNNGRLFASRLCTEEGIADHFRGWLVANLG